MNNFSKWCETFSGWEDRKADLQSIKNIENGLRQLRYAHPEYNQQLDFIKSMFDNYQSIILDKHKRHAPQGFFDKDI